MSFCRAFLNACNVLEGHLILIKIKYIKNKLVVAPPGGQRGQGTASRTLGTFPETFIPEAGASRKKRPSLAVFLMKCPVDEGAEHFRR